MAEGPPDRSTYGQFGRATYKNDRKQWLFERDNEIKNSYRRRGVAEVIVRPTLEQYSADVLYDPNGQPRRIEKQSKALIQACPELQPAFNLLPGLARISEAVEDAVERHDPSVGSLITYGSVTNPRTSASTEVVAFPCGLSGGDLRVMQVVRQERGWGDVEHPTVHMPVACGLPASWKGPGAPIQSITFSQPLENGNLLLAVRLLTRTLIFRLALIHRSRKDAGRLDLSLMFQLDTTQVTGLSHAHVSFNPERPRQFAVIDQAGHWSVNRFETGEDWNVEETMAGELMDPSEHESFQSSDDGWARISWTGPSEVLAICNRRKSLLFDLKSRTSLELVKATMFLDDGLDWNLDVVVLPSSQDYLLILTNTHILGYFVGRDDAEGLNTKCVLRCRHFRNGNDISLRIHVFRDDEDILLFLRSDLDACILVYRLSFSDAGFVTISDPAEFDKNAASPVKMSPSGILAMHLHPVTTNNGGEWVHGRSTSSASTLGGVRYYAVTWLLKDLSLLQTLHSYDPNEQNKRVISQSRKISPEPDLTVSFPASKDDSSTNSRIVGVRHAKNIPKARVSNYVQERREAQSNAKSLSDWTVNYELTFKLLNVESSKVADMNKVIDKAGDALKNANSDEGLPFQTLRELEDGNFIAQQSDDLDAMQSIQESMHTIGTLQADSEPEESSDRLILGLVGWPPSFEPDLANASRRFSSLHQSILSTWITPLPEEVPEILRSAQEGMALQMATEVTLASLLIRTEAGQDDPPGQSQDQIQNFGLPVRHARAPSSSRATPSVYFDASSQLQSSASQATSTVTSSSQTSILTSPEVQRLSRYTTFSQPAPPLLLRSLNRVLSHWQPGSDLEDYDWQTVSRRLTQDDEEAEGEELTEKQRQRLQRRAEQYVKRQRREAEESQRLQMRNVQAPELVTASQPKQSTAAFGQDGASSQLPESQVVRGRFGGRKPAKKKRKSGF